MSIAACALWVLMMWDAIGRAGLLLWAGGILFAITMRASLSIRYRMINPHSEEFLRWERACCLTLLPGTVIWGIGAPLILVNGTLLNQLITYLFWSAFWAWRCRPATLHYFDKRHPDLAHGPALVDLRRTHVNASGGGRTLATAKGIRQHASAVYESYRLRHELHGLTEYLITTPTLMPLRGHSIDAPLRRVQRTAELAKRD